MPRQPRLILPDLAVHIVQRGNNRAPCFLRDGDYMLYLYWLRELSKKHGCKVHAYCLMTNHVHILLTPAAGDACGSLMRDLGQRYVQHFNRAHGRTGTLWEGRFRSCVAESGRYVMACYRYIELNPVRAGMVNDPCDYTWSSHRINTGDAKSDWLTSHPEFTALGNCSEARQRAYRQLFEGALDSTDLERIRAATNGGYLLGDAAFGAKIAAQYNRPTSPRRPGRPSRAPA
jgi:putative transposase